jgi:hypothetical protein
MSSPWRVRLERQVRQPGAEDEPHRLTEHDDRGQLLPSNRCERAVDLLWCSHIHVRQRDAEASCGFVEVRVAIGVQRHG